MRRFRSFVLDEARRQLRRDGAEVHLTPKAFDALVLLVDAAPRVVRKSELHDRLWPNGIVSDASLVGLVGEIRRALRDDDRGERMIRAVPRVGYAFDAPVAAARSGEPQRSVPSIAVLPFVGMSADRESEYFSDGLAEEIINVLAKMPGLKVAGRTSSFFFRGKDVELEEIGQRLNVDHILEGSVRKSGSRLRVTAQLIKVADGFHLWSERYDREMTDIFALQDDVTHAIATALQVQLSPNPAPLRRHAPDLRAYDAYLKALDQWSRPTPESLMRVKEHLDRAIALDPEFAPSYTALGMYYSMQASLGNRPTHEVIPLARAAVHEALRIDPSLSEPHALLGVWAGGYGDYDWHRAEQHWRLALAREPVSYHVRFWYGNHYLLPLGRYRDALDAMAKGLEGDPINLLYRHHFADGLRNAGQLEEAEVELRRILELDGSFAWAVGTLGRLCAQQGELDEALALSEKAYALTPLPLAAGQLAALLARTGETSRADTLLEGLRPGTAWGASTGMAMFHALCGELEQAAEWVERAIEDGYPRLVAIFRPLLGSSRRWPALARMMNLPEPPRGGSG
ncbi:MAG TPA: winged helix-turn-helix domain-containing protein [Dehalococcoidia bacterium]|jgi:TolB-like protein/Tfp pilus assembly protein PilF